MDDGQEFALVGGEDRVEPEQFGQGAHSRGEGKLGFLHLESPGAAGNPLVERSPKAPPSEVAHQANAYLRLQQGKDQTVERSGVALQGVLEGKPLAGGKNGEAVIAQGSVDQESVSRLGGTPTRRPAWVVWGTCL